MKAFSFLLDLNIEGYRTGLLRPTWHPEGEGLSVNGAKTMEVEPRDGKEKALPHDTEMQPSHQTFHLCE